MPDFLADVLSQPRNNGWLRLIRAAKDWGERPSFFIFGSYTGIKKKQLEKIDRRLMEAFSILEAETCKSCGVPSWHSRSTDNTIDFKVDKVTCYGCAHLNASDIKKKAKDSETVFISAVPIDGYELPTRQDFLER